MIEIILANILGSKENIICQQVNCQGVMGAGLAKQIKEMWPIVYHQYHNECQIIDQEYLLGNCSFVGIGKDKYVANIFSQFDYGRDKNKLYTNYSALKSGLEYIKENASLNNYSIAIPYGIGCGLANGDWKNVLDMIEEVFLDFKNVVRIYKLQ